LEQELKIISLEKARNTQPWELITNPTLLSDPVGPSRTMILAIFFFFGIISSSLVIYFQEIKSDKIFDKEFLKSSFDKLDIFNFQGNKIEESFEELYLLANKIYKDKESKIIDFIPLGDLNKEIISKFKDKLDDVVNEELDIKFIKKISELRDQSKIILIVKFGESKKNELLKLKRDLLIELKSIMAILIIYE